MPLSCCQITDRTFGEQDARGDIREYRRHGVPAQTREMLRAIRSLGLSKARLLDIGGGAGVIHHELLRDVAATAVHVDASSAYLQAAEDEASRLGHAGRIEFIHADFADVAAQLPDADLVTLDRVVCCYPDFRTLLGAAASKAASALGLSYPRRTWYVRLSIHAINLLQRLRRDPFRVYVHDPADMDAVLTAAGLRRLSLKRFSVWEVAMYRRDPA